MKYRIFLTAISSLLLATGCDVLDVRPTQSIPLEEAITSRNGLERALAGSYDAMQSSGYYGRDAVAVADLAADNLNWTGTTADYNQISNNTILSDNGVIENLWYTAYIAINRVNYVIDALPRLTDLSQDDRTQYQAEAHFLRALHHFNLVRAFGGVPVRVKPVKATQAELNVPRNTPQQVYQQIFEDLKLARRGRIFSLSSNRASRGAAYALSARVFLTYYSLSNNTQHLDSAIFYASRTIQDFGYQLEPSYASVFRNLPNKEAIFFVDFSAQDRNRLAEYFFTRTLGGRKEFSPSPSLVSAFPAADSIRAKNTFAIAPDGPYGCKYIDLTNGSDRVLVFRLAEMHLIVAEATALKGGDLTIVRNHLNLLRQRAGVSPITGGDANSLLLAIENERRLEFALEGHRWYDLVRTHRANVYVPGLADCYKLFPIPLSEIQSNEAINASDQNPCY